MQRESIAHKEQGSLWEGASLVAGTAIGGGMLAIPLFTFQGGFLNACIVSLVAWSCLTATGLAFCRVLAVSPDGQSFLALTNRWLGRSWTPLVSALFMGLIWLLLVAYSAGGGSLLSFGLLSPLEASLLFVLPLIWVLAKGRATTSHMNSWMFCGLLLVGGLFALLAGPQWSMEGLQTGVQQDFIGWWTALPVLFAAFGFHNVLPTMRMQLGADSRRLSQAVLLGTTLALVLVVGWQALVFGCLSSAEIAEIVQAGRPVTCAVAAKSSWAALFSGTSLVFAYLAMATSFLGVAQAGLEVLRQGNGQGKNRTSLIVLVGSAWIAAMLCPDIFGRALSAAGGFGVSLLNGVLPVALLCSAARLRATALTSVEQMAWILVGCISLAPIFIEIWANFR